MNIKFAGCFLRDFFNLMNKNGINYLVLRNYTTLPENNTSKDVDVLVFSNDYCKVKSLFTNLVNELGYMIIWKNGLDYLEGFVIVKIEENNLTTLKIDFFKGLKWRGLVYISEDILFNNKKKYKNFYIPTYEMELVIFILYDLLYAKKVREKYYKYLEKLFRNADYEVLLNLLSKIIGNVSVEIMKILKKKNYSELAKYRKVIILYLLKINLKNKKFLKNLKQHIITEYIKRKKFGVFLSFSGPDGAGKSSLLEDLMQMFYSLGITKSSIPYHLLTDKVPTLHKLPVAPKKYSVQDYTKPYQAKPVGLVSSMIRVGYYFFAFLLDRLIYINSDLKKNYIVVFDRYYIDFMVDPKRMRISINKKFIQKLFFLLPKPHKVYIILADKKLILKRKNELQEDKLDELLQEYKKLCNKYDCCEVYYNNNDLEISKRDLYNRIFNFLEGHYK